MGWTYYCTFIAALSTLRPGRQLCTAVPITLTTFEAVAIVTIATIYVMLTQLRLCEYGIESLTGTSMPCISGRDTE